MALQGQNSREILTLPPPEPGDKIPYGPGEFQFGELSIPDGKGPHPAVIVIHGGFWRAAYDLKHTRHLCAALQRAGIAVWNIEYRRLGNPGGGWTGTFDDVRSAAEHIVSIAGNRRLNPKRIIAMGHSAGGHLALWLAKYTQSLRGVVALAPISDLRRAFELKLSRGAAGELIGGSPDEFPARYKIASPVEMLPIGVPMRIIHGSSDDTVPLAMTRDFVTAARTKGDRAELIETEGGHFELIDPRSRQWSVVEGAVRGLLQ